MLVYILASLVGLSLGLLGSGGSVLAVPILRYSAGLSAQEAVAGSLATVGAVSFLGALWAWKQGRIKWRVGLKFTLVASAGTFVGVEIATQISEKAQMLIFAAVLAYAFVRMLQVDSGPAKNQSGTTTGFVLKALGVGVLTGIVGVGGGFLIVPALVALFGLSMKDATGTSLLIIAANSAIGTAAYSQSTHLDWSFLSTFLLAAILGLGLGLKLVSRVNEGVLRKVFAALLGLVCCGMLFQELA